MNKTSIIILAAGAGTRMKSSLPKVLHKISGKEMLYYSIKAALELSDDVTVVLYHQYELVKKTMEKYFPNKIKYLLQDLENYPGTGGAVMGISPCYEKTLVLNGDMPLIQADELRKFDSNDTIVMSVLELDCANGYGRVIIKDEKVVKIIEQKDANEKELEVKIANAGIYQFNTEFLLKSLPKLSNDNAQKEYYITDLVEMAINDNKSLKPLIVNVENFKGVNSKLDLSQAEVIHQNRIKNDFLSAGVIMRLPSTIYIEEAVKIEGETILENGVTLLGNTHIISSTIKTNTIVEDSKITNSSAGPMARIRPGSDISNTHIGNFVETKKAKLNGVKAGHLSYLGDCEIDEGTNIGCGTITCNYDGINKHKTIIGKNVFVGSDTQLIAPVTIASNSMIAAGSTISKDVNEGDLVITRAPLKIVKNYFYRFFKKEKI